jgi:hypothetical protein
MKRLMQRFRDWKDPFEAYKRRLRNERRYRKAIAFGLLYGADVTPEQREAAATFVREGDISQYLTVGK